MTPENIPLIDSHIHLDDPRLAENLELWLQQARSECIQLSVVPAVTRQSWPRVKHLCDNHAGCFPAYGLHPYFLKQHRPDDVTSLRHWLQQHKAVALGECGLDHYRQSLDRQQQAGLLEQQLSLAAELELPVILHANHATEAIMQSLKKYPVKSGVLHSYNGSWQQAKWLIKRGFLLGFGAAITYPAARKLRHLASTLPLECLLLETDAPDQPPALFRGQLNRPAWLRMVFDTLADLRQEPPGILAERLNANAQHLFGLPHLNTGQSPQAG